jgi:parallel beta-helix repeat protein
MRKKIALALLVVGIIFTSLVINTLKSASTSKERDSKSSLILSLTSHDPIFIDNDIDFVDYGFPGNGSKINPYIIEDYSFENESFAGIYIKDTNDHFVIQNCFADSYEVGIYINDVAAGTASVLNNICVNNGDSGIIIQDSNKITLINNTCKYSVFAGILLLQTTNCNLINNTCLFNYWGAGLEASSDSYVFNNEFNFNTGYGFVLNVGYGNFLSNNSCSHNPTGIYSSSSDICLFVYNRIEKNSEYGIYLNYQSDGNTIHHNDFIRNNLAGSSQGYDEGIDNIFYDSSMNEGNYWSNYGGSGGYIIDGEAYSVDLYPLNEGGTLPDISEYNSNRFIFLTILLSILVVSIKFKKKKK